MLFTRNPSGKEEQQSEERDEGDKHQHQGNIAAD